MGTHVKHEYDPFNKWISCVNPNMTRTRLVLAHYLFINGLVMSGLRIVSNFATPSMIPLCF